VSGRGYRRPPVDERPGAAPAGVSRCTPGQWRELRGVAPPGCCERCPTRDWKSSNRRTPRRGPQTARAVRPGPGPRLRRRRGARRAVRPRAAVRVGEREGQRVLPVGARRHARQLSSVPARRRLDWARRPAVAASPDRRVEPQQRTVRAGERLPPSVEAAHPSRRPASHARAAASCACGSQDEGDREPLRGGGHQTTAGLCGVGGGRRGVGSPLSRIVHVRVPRCEPSILLKLGSFSEQTTRRSSYFLQLSSAGKM